MNRPKFIFSEFSGEELAKYIVDEMETRSLLNPDYAIEIISTFMQRISNA
jgi:hypothetical protein